MRKIVVTGGAGRLGRLAIQELLDHGYEVLATDRVRPREPLCRFLPVELTDAAAVHDVIHGADAVLHLGAIPGPGGQTQPEIFHNNVDSTFNVVHAAGTLGVGRLVFASTVFALGWVDQAERFWPRYVPVDEEHPQTPFEAYGLSKQIGEQICAAAWRRYGLPSISLRIMNVIHPESYDRLPWPPPTREQPVRFVLWPYVDARDVARACRLALEAKTNGHKPLYLAAKDIRFDRPTRELLGELAPAELEIRGPLDHRASIIDCTKAKELIGWEPQHSWQSEKDQEPG